tara:strand:+ start:28 stop:894 length:867 start_codon:yes stop_codon:yes gene_type:complete
MNFLVTGGAGFIGSHLVDRLIEDGHNVDVLDNFCTGFEKNKNSKANYIVRDIRDNLDDLNGYDTIFHLAALARIQPSFDNPLETIGVNTQGTANICELARRLEAKVVYAGSSSFYGGAYLNPYAFTKWQGEEICKIFSNVYNLSTAIARFFNVYGRRHVCSGAYATVIGIFERQYKDKEVLTITGDGEQRRDFTHVSDIVSGLILMGRERWSGEIFNLGTGNNHSINELAAMYLHNIKYIAKRPGEAKNTLADISFSKKELGYNPEIKLSDYVSDWLKCQNKVSDIKD